MDIGLTLAQWAAFGAALKKIHTARLPADLIPRLARETFHPPWSEMVRRVQAQLDQGEFRSATETQFAAFWQERREEIARITDRCEELGGLLRGEANCEETAACCEGTAAACCEGTAAACCERPLRRSSPAMLISTPQTCWWIRKEGCISSIGTSPSLPPRSAI